MFDFIPVGDYTLYFDISVLILVLTAVWQCWTGSVFQRDTITLNAGWGYILIAVLVLYMGQRQVSYYFGDTVNYANTFYNHAESLSPFVWRWQTEWLFHNMLRWFAKYSDIHTFFTVCSLIYCGSLWWAMKRMFKSYYYIPFIVILSMFTFWQYGVNGIRNGMGASLFILALSYIDNLPLAILIALTGVGMHSSVAMMIGAAGIAWLFNNSYYYLAGWLLSVVLSYFAGMTIQSYIAGWGVITGDDRFTGYMTGENQIGEIVQTTMEFRWDFLLYSAMAVFVGYYFIFVRKFKDEYYHWIYNIYLITNAFWVLVIRSSYSNRIAQISWFIMPIVLIYPFMKRRFWQNHERMTGIALLVFYVFAFYYNIVRS